MDAVFLRDEIKRVEIDIALARKRGLQTYAEQLKAWVAEMEAELASQQRVLACHSKGDRRFSALFSRVEVLGKSASIEAHYQLSKRFAGEEPPKMWREAKGRIPNWFELGGRRFAAELLPQYYSLLWCKYLDGHPELVEEAAQYDSFVDIFAQPGHVSQAVCIEIYCKQGRLALLAECQEFLKEFATKL